MARVRKSQETQSARKGLTVSRRDRLIAELRADPTLAAEYPSAAAEDRDPRVYLVALRTVAEPQDMAKVAKAAGVPRESLYRALSSTGNSWFSARYP